MEQIPVKTNGADNWGGPPTAVQRPEDMNGQGVRLSASRGDGEGEPPYESSHKQKKSKPEKNQDIRKWKENPRHEQPNQRNTNTTSTPQTNKISDYEQRKIKAKTSSHTL